MSTEYKSFKVPIAPAMRLQDETSSKGRSRFLKEFVGYVTNIDNSGTSAELTTSAVGTPRQALSGNKGGSGMWVDTGNAYTAIGAIGCDCKVQYVQTNGYNATASTTHQNVTSTMNFLMNDSINPSSVWLMNGQLEEDTLCLLNTQDTFSCASNFTFFSYNMTNHADSGDGFIGLAPKTKDGPDSFLTALAKQGKINPASVTFFLSPMNLDESATNYTQSMQLGGLAPNSDTGYVHTTQTSGQWTLNLNKMSVNGTDFATSADYVVPSPQAAGIIMNAQDYANFYPILTSVFNMTSGEWHCDMAHNNACYNPGSNCTEWMDVLPSLSFKIDNTNYTLPASSYAISYVNVVNQFYTVQECYIAIGYDNMLSNSMILGVPFLQNFVPTFNID